MSVLTQAYRHPTQASEVSLRLFEEPDGRFLVTDSRSGTATVVATLGVFDRREDALDLLKGRGQELGRQRYELVAS